MALSIGIGVSRKGISLLLGVSFCATAVAQTIPLRHGVYVLKTSECKDAPNAAIMVWDGVGFSGAHSSGCTSHFVRLPTGGYRVTTSCTALGDGTLDPESANLKDTMTLARRSSTEFTSSKPAGTQLTYRWCSAK